VSAPRASCGFRSSSTPTAAPATCKSFPAPTARFNRASIDAVSNWKFMPVDEVLSIETELAYKYD
jgi:hypothetical protein